MKNNGRKFSTLRSRFLIIVFLAILPYFFVTNILFFNTFRVTRNQFVSQIENTTTAIHNLYDSLLRSSITTYLRGKVEAGEDIINHSLSEYRKTLSAEELKTIVINKLLHMRVGESGYFYGFNSAGVIVFHPDPNLVGSDLKNVHPVDQQLEQKEGYLEYEWQNTYEDGPRKKALYMTYIPEFDWYITATSYRSEFTVMIDHKSIKQTVLSMKFGASGYSYVISRSGDFIAHPRYSSEEDAELLSQNDYAAVSEQLFKNSEQFSTYYWRDDENSVSKKKIVFSKYIEDFDWVVATAMYISEINDPLTMTLTANIILTVIAAFLMFFVIRKLSRSIETPISSIYITLNKATAGDLGSRTTPSGPDEIKLLGKNLNRFIETLDIKTRQQESTIREKEKLIREIQHRINNNLQTINSIINLQYDNADLPETQLILKDLQKRIIVISMVYDHMLLSNTKFTDDTLKLSDFIEDYIFFFIDSYDISSKNLKVVTEFEDIYIQRNMAICCGLIVNELLTRWYGNTELTKTEADIFISIKKTNNTDIELSAADSINSFDSHGLCADIGNLPCTFINVLSNQLNGRLSFEKNDSGSVFRLVFPDKLPKTLDYSSGISNSPSSSG